MAKLSKAQRDALPASDFAGPNRTFPIEDADHQRAAIMDSHGSEHAAILAAVRRKRGGAAHTSRSK